MSHIARESLLRRLTALIVSALTLCGCSILTTKAPPTDCSWLKAGASTDQPQAQTVIVLDGSASFAAGDRAEAAQAVSRVLREDFDVAGSRLLSIGTFGGANGVDWTSIRLALPDRTGSGRNEESDFEALTECTDTLLDGVGTAEGGSGSDLAAAVRAGSEKLLPGDRRRLVVMTDGLSNRGCLDLRAQQDATVLLERCRATGELSVLTDVRLELSGIGEPAYADLSPQSGAKEVRLTNLWQALCSGLSPGGSEPCLTEDDWGSVGPRAPRQATASDSAIDVLIPAPPRLRGDTVEIDIPADMLFESAQDRLSATAERAVQEAVQQYLDGAIRARVDGYTDSQGTGFSNLGLSRRRARSVAKLLRSWRLSRVDAVGHGETDPVCSPDTNAQGRLIPDCAQQNRRVHVTIWGK